MTMLINADELRKKWLRIVFGYFATHYNICTNEITQIFIFRCVLLDIYFGLEKRKDDDDLSIFNLISHSFGIPNLQNHILFLLSYIEEELRILKNI